MANVYTSVNRQEWYTDKVRISVATIDGETGGYANVQVTFTDGAGNAIGNLYTPGNNGISIPAGSIRDLYVGVGNDLSISPSSANVFFTAQELGTASSGTAGVTG